MAVVGHSPPLFFAFSPLPATARRTEFATRSWTWLARFPVLSCLPHSGNIPATNAFARAALRDKASSQQFVYPDPVPEFAESETKKFKAELRRKLCEESETFGNDLDAVLDVCSQIFGEFLHDEYGGPGTLLVEPFTDMMLALKDENLPGAAFAARASLLWAQSNVDRDWESWNAANPSN